jgi:hypothetical protein
MWSVLDATAVVSVDNDLDDDLDDEDDEDDEVEACTDVLTPVLPPDTFEFELFSLCETFPLPLLLFLLLLLLLFELLSSTPWLPWALLFVPSLPLSMLELALNWVLEP